MPRPSDRQAGAVWRLLEQWSAQHPLQPNQRQMARLFEISESLLSSWKYMDSVVQHQDIDLIASRTALPRKRVADAAAEDLQGALANVAKRRGSSTGRKRRRVLDALGEENQDPEEDL